MFHQDFRVEASGLVTCPIPMECVWRHDEDWDGLQNTNHAMAKLRVEITLQSISEDMRNAL